VQIGLDDPPVRRDSAVPPVMSRPGLRQHTFHALAFVENFALREMASAYPGADRTAHRLQTVPPGGGRMFVFRFGAIVFHNVSGDEREAALARLRRLQPGLTPVGSREEELLVIEDGVSAPGMEDGKLRVERMTPERAGLIAQTIAQGAALEYYERRVEEMFVRLEALVQRMAKRGSVPLNVRPLHCFIGEALSTRREVLSVLHLLEEPAGVAGDPAIEPVYIELRDAMELSERHQSVLQRLRRVQESLQVLLDAARDSRFVLLELAVAILIVVQIAITLFEG
jgi:required for meiotic nuclear division protein 1